MTNNLKQIYQYYIVSDVKTRHLVVTAILIIVLTSIFHWTQLRENIENLILDNQFKVLQSIIDNVQVDSNEIVIIGINEQTRNIYHEPFGLWHSNIARLLDALSETEPEIVGINLVLPSDSIHQIDNSLDIALLKSLLTLSSAANVVLTQASSENGVAIPIYAPFVSVVGGLNHVGNDLVILDDDRAVRRHREFSDREGVVPSFSGQVARHLGYEFKPGIINYAQGSEFSYIPFHTVIDWAERGNVSNLEKFFKGKVVLIGDATDSRNRNFLPVKISNWSSNNYQPAIVLQAQVIRNLMNGGLIQDTHVLVTCILTISSVMILFIKCSTIMRFVYGLAWMSWILVMASIALNHGIHIGVIEPVVIISLALISRLYVNLRIQNKIAEYTVVRNNARDELILSISHDLKTPLTAILGLVDKLKPNFSNPKELHAIDIAANTINNQINNLLVLGKESEENHILPVKSDINIYRELAELYFMMETSAENSGNKLSMSIATSLPSCISIANDELNSILMNLIRNSIKYTENGKIRVRVSAEGDNLCIAVKDDGRGIPKDVLDQVFEKYHRFYDRNSRRNPEGNGLGLSITSRLVRSLGGTINASSKYGRGSTFTVRIPYGAPHIDPLDKHMIVYTIADVSMYRKITALIQLQNVKIRPISSISGIGSDSELHANRILLYPHGLEVGQIPASWKTIQYYFNPGDIDYYPTSTSHWDSESGGYWFTEENDEQLERLIQLTCHMTLDLSPMETVRMQNTLQGRSILFADDDDQCFTLFKDALLETGCELTTFRRGDEATDALLVGDYDLAIMDMNMPGKKGIQAADAYKQNGKDKTKIVILSADHLADLIRKDRNHSVDLFITKPILPKKLIPVLIALLDASEKSATDGASSTPPAPATITFMGPANAQHLNQDAFRQAFIGKNSGLNKNAINVATKATRERVEEILSACDQRDYDLFHQGVHKLKGSSGMIGAEQLFKSCSSWHRHSREEFEAMDLPSIKTSLSRDYSLFSQALESCIEEYSSKQSTA